MTSVEKMTDEQFRQFAIELLRREAGPDGVARFLRVYRSTGSDYTRDRHEWQKELTVDRIIAAMNSGRA